jgi:ATP-dependent RNA helicase DDX1
MLLFSLFFLPLPQVCFFSATLHSPDIKRLSEQICHNPTWVDLKGTDTVPDTVHHVLVRVQPEKDCHYCAAAPHPAVTDKLHPESGGGKRAVAVTASSSRAEKSQALKCIKQHMLVKLIDQFEVRE